MPDRLLTVHYSLNSPNSRAPFPVSRPSTFLALCRRATAQLIIATHSLSSTMLSRLMLKIRHEILIPGAYTFSLGTGRGTPDLEFHASGISHEEGPIETGIGRGSDINEIDADDVGDSYEGIQSKP